MSNIQPELQKIKNIIDAHENETGVINKYGWLEYDYIVICWLQNQNLYIVKFHCNAYPFYAVCIAAKLLKKGFNICFGFSYYKDDDGNFLFEDEAQSKADEDYREQVIAEHLTEIAQLQMLKEFEGTEN